uniref:Alpha-conotoxin OI n=1 Tax=Conus obscurus TaxID=89447 RepID=CA1A_CONOB|nr:RecName: Full=Alpha-conotoxin OI; AltName: Full=Alpha-conotoxin OIA [Conus obscurus]
YCCHPACGPNFSC